MNFKKESYIIVILITALFTTCNYKKLEQSKNDTILKERIDNNSSLGIVYDANYLRSLLTDKEKESPKNYKLAGLVFKNIVEKEFALEVLYYSSSDNNAFCSEPISNLDLESKYYASISNDNEDIIQLENQNLIKQKSNLKFWDIMGHPKNNHMKPFVYFSKNDLELLLAGDVESITFSGAQINYDVGIRNFEVEAVNINEPTAYPTMKAERKKGNSNNNEYIPNVVLGQPCPPLWSNLRG